MSQGASIANKSSKEHSEECLDLSLLLIILAVQILAHQTQSFSNLVLRIVWWLIGSQFPRC